MDSPLARTLLVVRDDAYERYPDDDEARQRLFGEVASGCLPGDRLIELVLCSGSMNAAASVLERVELDAEYEGRAAVAVFMRPAEPGDLGRTMQSAFYAEPDTFLPLAFTAFEPGKDPYYVVEYQAELVDASALPMDLFDPAALGYTSPEEKEQQAINHPRLGGVLYWLGREFDPGDGLPALPSLGIEGWYNPARPALVRLQYANASDWLTIEQWNADEWQAFHGQIARSFGWLDACGTQREFAVNGGSVRILGGWEFESPLAPDRIVPHDQPIPTVTPLPTPTALTVCPSEPPNRWMAEVTFGDRVVTLNAPLGLAGDPRRANAYNTPEGLEAAARALRLRQPGE